MASHVKSKTLMICASCDCRHVTFFLRVASAIHVMRPFHNINHVLTLSAGDQTSVCDKLAYILDSSTIVYPFFDWFSFSWTSVSNVYANFTQTYPHMPVFVLSHLPLSLLSHLYFCLAPEFCRRKLIYLVVHAMLFLLFW